MKRNVWFLLWWVAALLSFRELYAQTSIDNGLSYLHSTQFPDGSWGGTASSTTDIIPATETIVETLRLLESAPSSQQLLGRSYLSSQTLFETDYIARRILALVGTPSFVALDQTTLLSFQNKVGGTTFVNDSGWGGLAGYGSTVLDSALALRGLAAAHFSSPNIIGPALNYLFSSQNLDGGWGFAKGQASQVYYTSLALLALKDFQPSFDVSASVIAGTHFLVTHQNGNGSFGSGSGTPFETALGLQAMLRFVVDPAKRGAAVNYLVSTQAANGSWGDDPYSTALALRALKEAQDGDSIIDNDGDGFSEQQGDCNDADAAIYPGALDLTVDGIDQDCNGGDGPLVGDTDGDGDGFTVAQGDCNDTDANIYPSAFERPNDGIDQDCNGSDATASGSAITSARMFKSVGGEEIVSNTFGAYESVRVDVILDNPDTLIWVIVNNAIGGKVLTVGNQTEGLGFNTLNLPPGDYTLTVVAYSGANFVVEEVRDLPFTIQPGFGIANVILGVLPEFSHVGAVETEEILLLFSNQSNVSGEVAVTYQIRTPSGATLNGGSVPLSLSASAPSLSVTLATFNHTFTEAGEYPIEARLFAGSELLATASAKIFVAPTIRIDPSKTITPQTIPPGENKQIQIDIRLEGVEQGP